MTKIYSYEEAYEKSLQYFNNNELAASVFLGKYALRNYQGQLLESSPSEMHRRLAKEFARVERKKYHNTKIKPFTEDEVYSFLENFNRVILQGSPMFAVGNYEQFVSTSNCFVSSSPADSYGAICRTDEELAQISKRRGGVGTDLSHLRPHNVPTQNSARTSTGIIPFAIRYSNTIREVGQAGRRGALMTTIDITHPESVIVWDDEVDGEPYPVKVETKDFSFETTSRYYNPDKVDFCTMKYDPTKVTGANVSIRINNKFMEAVKNDDYFEQKWPVDSDNPVISKRTKARKMWDKIVRSAWQTAEPGILMWDNIIMESPADCYAPEYKTTSTNPCGEIPLSAYDACRLLLSNLYSFVINPFTPEAYFDYKEFFKYSKITQRLMDDLVDLEVESVERILNKIDRDPEDDDIKAAEKRLWEKILVTCKSARRTGNGITALGDALAALNIPYGSEKGIETVDKIYKTLKFGSYQQSAEMAEVLGHFEGWSWEKEKDNPFINRISQEKIQLDDNTEIDGKNIIDFIKKHGRRNISNLTTAPVGSISLLAKIGNYFGTTSGIEPQYSVVPYLRRKKINPADENTKVDYVDQNGDKWQEYKVYPSSLKEWMDITGKTDYKESPWWNHCAEQLNWEIRVKLQAAAQKHIDHSISSTLNLPKDVPVDEVKKIYETAYESGCKGVTIYRDGCRSGVLVKNNEKNENKIVKTKAPKRPKELPCDIHHMTVNRHRYYVVVGLLEKDPYEIWVGSNHDEDGEIVIPKSQKNGIVVKEKRGSYKLVSNDKKNVLLKSVRQGADENIDVVTRTLSFALRHGGSIEFAVDQLEKTKGDMTSFTKVLARTLKKYIENGSKVSGQTCPSCGSEQLIRQEGCITCASCGWAKC